MIVSNFLRSWKSINILNSKNSYEISSSIIRNSLSTCSIATNHLFGSHNELKILSLGYQQLRWKKTPYRKPFWLPRAKTKLYHIPKEPNVPPEEFAEICRLFCNYHTYMKAITNYFKAECREMSETGKFTIAKTKIEQEEFNKLLEENQIENERVKMLREARLDKELKEEEERLLLLDEEHSVWLKHKKEEIEEIVRHEKELSKTYITMSNLEEAIEKCLDDPVNYNFSIDLDGKVYWETTAHPEASPYRH